MTPKQPPTPILRAFAIGAVTTLGWSVYELTMLARSGDPGRATELFLPHAAACLLGGLLGIVLIARLWSLVLCLVLAFLATRFTDHLPAVQRGLPSALRYLSLATSAGFFTSRLKRVQPETAALALGVLVCAFLTHDRAGPRLTNWPLINAAVLALGLACVPPVKWRAVGLILLVPLALYPNVKRYQYWMSGLDFTAAPEAEANAGAPNILLVVLDTVRSDRLVPYGYGRETTPRLNRFVEEHATVLENARSTSSWTLPSHASLFTGLPAAVHGATHVRIKRTKEELRTPAVASRLDPNLPTLAGRLEKAGWSTAAIFANHAFLSRDYGLDRGFQHYDSRRGPWLGSHRTLVQHAGFSLDVGHVPTRDGSSITEEAIAWLEQHDGDKPFFLALNYMDAHSPFLPPARYDELFEDGGPSDPLNPRRSDYSLLYDRGLRHLDDGLAPLLDWIEGSERFDNTLIVVTADHGDALGEQGYWEHDWTLYEAMVRIPLYIKPPGGRAILRRPEPFGLDDLHDLILATAGLEEPRPPRGWVGEWFHDPDRDRLRISDYVRPEHVNRDLLSWIEGDTKLIVASTGLVEAYDLAADPMEESPLALDPAKIEAALERARAWWADHPPRASNVELDEETLEALRALGYAGND